MKEYNETPPKEDNGSAAYMDTIRDHRERAFEEGAREMCRMFMVIAGQHPLPLPENPYRRKEDEQKTRET